MVKNLALLVLSIGIILAVILLYREKTKPIETPIIVDEQPVITNPKENLIKVTSPTPNQKISSPLTISGEARGYWYFEASFPAELVDSNGVILWQGPVQASTDWMTENFVPFEIQIPFIKPAGETSGKLILHKDNPSGLPENDDSIEIPVSF